MKFFRMWRARFIARFRKPEVSLAKAITPDENKSLDEFNVYLRGAFKNLPTKEEAEEYFKQRRHGPKA